VVVPAVLDAGELESIRRGSLEAVHPKLVAVAAQARDEAGIETDTLANGAQLAATPEAEWHQSYTTFFVLQQHRHHLQFWIPLEKSDPRRTDLSVLPMDALIARAPHLRDVVVGGGASRLRVASGRTELSSDELCIRATLDFDVDELAVAPVVSPGDLIVLRGDVFHRMQTPFRGARLVMTDANAVVRKRRLLEGSREKHRRLLREPLLYAKLLTYFNKYNRREARASELLPYLSTGRASRWAMAIAMAELVVNWRELPTRSIA
jgi:hypothetical protein